MHCLILNNWNMAKHIVKCIIYVCPYKRLWIVWRKELWYWSVMHCFVKKESPSMSLLWCHNEHDGVSTACLLSCLFRWRSKKTSKFRITGLCEGNSLVTGEFPTQRASNAESVSIWRRHCGILSIILQHEQDIMGSVQFSHFMWVFFVLFFQFSHFFFFFGWGGLLPV